MTKQSVHTERHGNAALGGAETLAEGPLPPAWLCSSPAVHSARGAQLPCRPHRPGGPGSPPVHGTTLQKVKPHWAPSPAAGGLLSPCGGGRGVTSPGLCRSSCPFPALFPRLPLLWCFARLLPIPPDGATAQVPLTFTHGEQPWASPRRRPSGSICPQKAIPRCYSVLVMSNQDNQPGRQNQTAVGLTGTGRASTLLVSFHHALLRHEERRISTHALTAHLLGELKTT